jgi:hypothetical protein
MTYPSKSLNLVKIILD